MGKGCFQLGSLYMILSSIKKLKGQNWYIYFYANYNIFMCVLWDSFDNIQSKLINVYNVVICINNMCYENVCMFRNKFLLLKRENKMIIHDENLKIQVL